MNDPIEDVTADLQEQIDRAAKTPPGAGAFPGGNLLLGAVLARLKDAGEEELRALVEYLQGRLARYIGGAGAVPAAHPTSE